MSSLGGAVGGGCHRRDRVTFEPARLLRKVVAIEIARIVGLYGCGEQEA